MASSNIVDFLIRLRSNGGNAIQVARQVDRHLAQVERRAAAVGGALRRAFSLSNFSAAMMSIPGMQFLANPYTMAAAAVAAVAKVGMAAESTSVAFQTLLGSQEASKKMLDDIAAMDAKKVYGLNTVQEAAKQMLNFGVESEKVLTYLSQLGDIAGGDKQKLAALGLVFGQVTAAGKLSGQDLLQFINAGFNPLKELQALTGKSYADLQDAMSKGQITADMVAAAMQRATGEGGKFFGMTQAQAQTTGAKLQDMLSRLAEGALKVWETIQPLFNQVVDLLLQIIPPVMEVVNVVVGGILQVVTWVLKWKKELGILAVFLGTFWAMIQVRSLVLLGLANVVNIVRYAIHMWTVVQRYLNIVLAANPIGIIITLIGALVAVVIYCWHEFAGFRAFLITCWDVFKEMGNIIKDFVIDRIKELIDGIGELGRALKLLLSGKYEQAWTATKSAVRKLSGVDSATKAVQGVMTTYNNAGNQFQKNLATEQAKSQKDGEKPATGITVPGLLGSQEVDYSGLGKGGKKGKKGGKTASSIATGGTRNTAITMTIGKFFDEINVYMADKTDTAELERVILQSMNRALAIATSSDR